MKLLNWEKISNSDDFQKMVNDLFALEVNHPGYLSSNPRIGKDGGWDGRYIGNYMGLNGFWNFQAKWTKHNLNDAYKQLRAEVIKELEKAQKNNVDYLLFATNADLRVGVNDHVGLLEELNSNNKYVERFFVWPRENLDGLVRKSPFLRHMYFGDSQEPMFIPAVENDVFDKNLSNIFLGREDEIQAAKDFLVGNEEDLLIIHAGGGYGKSHFICEIAKHTNEFLEKSSAWHCRPNIREANDGFNELDHNSNYVILLDDAERFPNETIKILTHYLSFKPGKMKLILSCRSSGLEIIKNAINLLRINKYQTYDLPNLKEEILVELLHKVSGKKHLEHPERIVREFNSNLFLITTTGQLMRGEELQLEKIKEKIHFNLLHECEVALDNYISKPQLKTLLVNISAIIPFSHEHSKEINQKLADLVNIEVETLEEIYRKLIVAKVFTTVGRMLRFNPDMKGDIFLSVEIDKDGNNNLISSLLNKWLSDCPKTLVSNIAAASRHKESSDENPAIRNLIEEWITETNTSNNETMSKRLEMITPLVFLAPNEIASLLFSYIEKSKGSENDIYKVNRDNFGPVILRFLKLQGYENIVCSLILEINTSGLDGTYSNYTPEQLIGDAVSPLISSFSFSEGVLKELLSSMNDTNGSNSAAYIAVSAAKEILQGSHEYRDSYGATLTFGRRVLLYDGEAKAKVNNLRELGLEILRLALFSKNKIFQLYGLNIINEIGRNYPRNEDSFWERILEDKRRVVTWLNELAVLDISLYVLNKLENVLIHFWSANNVYIDISESAGNILRSIERTPEYIVFQYYISQNVVLSDFKKFESEAPDENRWSWLVHNKFRIGDDKLDDLTKALQELSGKYSNSEDILNYLVSLDQLISDKAQWQYVPLIEEWAKYTAQPFIGLLDDKALREKIPERFLLGIYRTATELNLKYLHDLGRKLAENPSSVNNTTIHILLDLAIRHNIENKDFISWIVLIFNNASSNIKSSALHQSYFFFRDRSDMEKRDAVTVILSALEGTIDSVLLNNISFLIHHLKTWNIPDSELIPLRTKLSEAILEANKIDYHIDNMFEFIFKNDLQGFLGFIDKRLQHQAHENDSSFSYEAIPYEGFNYLETRIIDYKTYKLLLARVHGWLKDDLIYDFEIEKILRKVSNKDEQTYLLQYIDEMLNSDVKENIENALIGIYGLPFNLQTANHYLRMILAANEFGLGDEVKDVFLHQVLGGGYSSNIGEAPPALVEKRKALESITAICSHGQIKNYLTSLIKSIENDIQRNIEEGQVILNPKN